MYTKDSRIKQSKQEVANYVEGFDVYNSALISKLSDPSIERVCYVITKYDYRPDLIAEDIYGDEKYLGLLLLTCPLGIESFKRGNAIWYIPKATLDSIIESV